MASYRTEVDSMGSVRVPAGAYYGAQTKRAMDNFPVSGRTMPVRFIQALALVKKSCCQANEELELLECEMAEWIQTAAQEVIDGDWDDQFPVDVYQTGSGTSTNMNVNEVIANRASELMGGALGSRHPVHPNDHVNMSQSSNDVIPSALHVAGVLAIHQDLLPALAVLSRALHAKAGLWQDVLKSGRTHMMDAPPVSMGQVFGGYAAQIDQGVVRVQSAMDGLLKLALGGTAVGTGLNRPKEFPALAIARIAEETDLEFVEVADHFAAQGAQDMVVEAHGQLKVLAVSLSKIAADVRLMASGPRTGLGELILPAVQPGSSIMPGKVNPVHCEMLLMVCAQVMGHDTTISFCGATGQLELNTHLPLLAQNLLDSIELLSSGARVFAERCVAGLEVDRGRCAQSLEFNLSLATALVPALGYDRSAELAKQAHSQGKSVLQVAQEAEVMPLIELQALLAPGGMIQP